MKFYIEKYISNFVQNQFPLFYKEQGESFILFVKTYYEWLESNNSLKNTANTVLKNDYNVALKPPLHQSRNILDYKDIDNTLEEFLEFFQKKYLYGIPFNVIINKRLLLKHILSVYRTKGTTNAYKLLFRLIYNEDIDVYLPSQDMLRVSDGKWIVPKYLEITRSDNLGAYVGKTIRGLQSKSTAVVESYIQENNNKNKVNVFNISNLLPRGGDFDPGEKIIIEGQDSSNGQIIDASPSVLGSMNNLYLINGGVDFKIGDILKIVQKDPVTGLYSSYGYDGLVKVTSIRKGFGQLQFDIINPGFGYLSNSLSFTYEQPGDSAEDPARFDVLSIFNTKRISYYTDVIADYVNTSINATSYGFPLHPAGNVSSNISYVLTSTNNLFGSILSLTNIYTGNGYTQPANTFVRSTLLSNTLWGTITYNTTANTVTGSGTTFDITFGNNDVIGLLANVSITSNIEYHVIKQVVNSTSLVLYDTPQGNSTATAGYKSAPTILPSNFDFHESEMYNPAGEIYGENEYISAYPSQGNGVIDSIISINSGKAYRENELISAYLYKGLGTVTVVNSGIGYTNNEYLIFSSGEASSEANGFVVTDSNGAITSVTLSYKGSGYQNVPEISVRTSGGSGGVLSTYISEYNTVTQVKGRVQKGGVGYGLGYWETTDSFLNSDKYIQDSNYYQDYSYDVKVAISLEEFKNILYSTFHSAGSELFSSFQSKDSVDSLAEILSETVTANTSVIAYYYTVDINTITCDNANAVLIACDMG